MKRRAKQIGTALLLGGAALAAWVCFVPFPGDLLDRARVTPPRVLDREGRLLRQGLASDGTRGRWVPLREVSPWVVTATLTAEDRRFRDHWGVDPLAALRAAKDGVLAGRRVSGASTISMQLVKLLRPRPRTWRTKLEEAVLAIRLERRLTKDEILEEYLNRAPYGGNFVGVEAGAWRAFGKPARDLSPAEAALLAGLPQAPGRLDPHRSPGRALARRQWILDEMRRLEHLDADAHRRAVGESFLLAKEGPACEAASFVDWALRAGDVELQSTLDLDLQRDVEGIVGEAAGHLQDCGADEAAVVVLDNATGEVRAFVGPAARRRSPGSALKPFVYALALESGRTPVSIYDDRPVELPTPSGVYAPRNYDGVYHGPVTLRAALANSLNVPAVLALRQVGVARAVEFLRSTGLEGIDPDPRNHGLGLTVGAARVSPVELAGAYAMLARGGSFVAPRGRSGPSAPRRLLEAPVAWTIADILSDDEARALSFGTGSDLAFDFRVGAKTGTSAEHRDNWVVGFTAEWTVAVWAGNPDGRPMRGTSGLEGAGPIFHAVMLRLPGGWPARPAGIEEAEVCAETGLRPGSGCAQVRREFFREGGAPSGRCAPRELAFRVESPQEGDRFVLDPAAPASSRFLVFRATAPSGASVEWLLDGRPLAVTGGDHCVSWSARRGAFELRARCGAVESVRRFRVR